MLSIRFPHLVVPFVLALKAGSLLACAGPNTGSPAPSSPGAASPSVASALPAAASKPQSEKEALPATLPYTPSVVRTPDGLSIAVQTWSDAKGTPIVFIHGLAQSHLSWERQTSSSLTGEFPIATYDLRGHGDSDKPVGPAYYEEGRRWGDELDAVLTSLGSRRPVVVGWSLGGGVIVSYLAAHGDGHLAGIVFVDAVTRMDRAQLPALPPIASPDLATRLAAGRRFLLDCFAAPPSGDALEKMLAYNAQVPRHVVATTFRNLLDGGDAALRAVRVPVLLVHGTEDKLIKAGMSQQSAAMIPGARLSLYERTGHAPFYEQPDRFNGEIRAFVRGL